MQMKFCLCVYVVAKHDFSSTQDHQIEGLDQGIARFPFTQIMPFNDQFFGIGRDHVQDRTPEEGMKYNV